MFLSNYRSMVQKLIMIEENIINVIHKRVDHTSERIKFLRNPTTNLPPRFSSPKIMDSSVQESRIIIAINASKPRGNLSIRKASAVYNVPYTTLYRRIHGRPSRRDITPNSKNLTESEEQALVRYILDLDSRAFPPRPSGVEDMVNRLRAARGASRVGKNWVSNFIKRRPELRTRWIRKYDHQRSKCEDPEVIGDWFRLVKNTIAKYGIVEDDIYNFDETGFLMGMIASCMVVTTSDGRSKAKLVQPGNREWATVIQGVNSRGWVLPPFIILKGEYHLSHWYTETGIPEDWVIATSKNGWTTNERGLEWIQHFDKHTKSRAKGTYRLLILDGHESHHSTDFELYCQEHNIITLCMPPHSSHILQPLDVGCFAALKKAYGRQIEEFMRSHINHISKVDFLIAFKAAFLASMTNGNITGGFRGAGLMPLDPEAVLSRLDVKLRTPTPTGPPLPATDSWTSKTPQTAQEASMQSNLIKTRISQHQNSSPTAMIDAVEQFAKGTTAIMHQVALLKAEVSSLRKANEALAKRRRAKKSRLRQGGSLSTQDAYDLLDERAIEEQIQQEMRKNGSQGDRSVGKERHCGNCGKTGHNVRTCQKDEEMSEESDSE